MSKRPTITTVSSGFLSNDTLNDNFTNIQLAFDNTVSRDGSTPNQMESDLDLNSQDLLNVKTVNASSFVLNGQTVTVGTVLSGSDIEFEVESDSVDVGNVGDGVPLNFSDKFTVTSSGGKINVELVTDPSGLGTRLDLIEPSIVAVATTGSANTYALTGSITSYTLGHGIRFIVNVANTGASTINVNSLGAKNIKVYDSASTKQDLVSGQLLAGAIYEAFYDGTDYVLANFMVVPASQSEAEAGSVVNKFMSPSTTKQAIDYNSSRAIFDTKITADSTWSTEEFTIEEDVVEITGMLNNISNSSNSIIGLRLGDSTSVKTTGYNSASTNITGNTGTTSTSEFVFMNTAALASSYSGHFKLTLLDTTTNRWIFSSNIGIDGSAVGFVSWGVISLTSRLTTVQIMNQTGTVFDLGDINIIKVKTRTS
jgi:hypothetical protein